ncbi:alpha-galactosidase [Corallincola platygyrae]|uniref:Alpha-galactosidase n=1 Tax=Corallincola platygyrae TaxID=1193278 RepID=A0ABW4XLV6_9GAMM
MTVSSLVSAPGYVTSPDSAESDFHLLRPWHDNEMRAEITNIAHAPARVSTVTLYDWRCAFSEEARIYGEGFQMLSQTGGWLNNAEPIGRCDDGEVYRLYDRQAETRVYSMLLVEDAGQFHLLGFDSSSHFSGYFVIAGDRIKVCLDLENITLEPYEATVLEGFVYLQGTDLPAVLDDFARHLMQNHPREPYERLPRGWCSWYHYYENVSAQDVLENLEALKDYPQLEFIQIDDGYQAFMGDWLTPSDKFQGGVRSLVDQIRAGGKRAGIWVAPFIAQRESHIFQAHPDWFVKDTNGYPLAAENVTYGGWRCTPWYILDGTHPGVINYLKHVIGTMRHEWGVDYFKLDANFWGAIHGGVFHRPNATRIEAYREGMAAINEAADGAFILGCNAPMWPSLGLVDGMRVSDDVERHWHRFNQIREETFMRNWQHGRLWLNDPDCLVLNCIEGQHAEEEHFRLHLAAIVGSAGILMLGDRLNALTDKQRESVHTVSRLLDSDYGAARFQTFDTQMGISENKLGRLICLTNAASEPHRRKITLRPGEQVNMILAGNYRKTDDTVEVNLSGYDGALIELVRS